MAVKGKVLGQTQYICEYIIVKLNINLPFLTGWNIVCSQISYLNMLSRMHSPHKHRHPGWCAWLRTCLSISTWIRMRLWLCEDQSESDRTVKWQSLPAKMRQVPNKSEGSDLPGKRVWRKLGSGEMAKRKCQIGAEGENVKTRWPQKRGRLPSHEESWQFETEREQVALEPSSFSWHPNLHCCIFNAAFPLPRPLALIAQVIE